MITYLLTWNPNKYDWEDIDEHAEDIKYFGFNENGWSCGNTKKISEGDRIFLLRQTVEPRGIIASGWVTSEESYEDEASWSKGGWSQFVDVSFDAILIPGQDRILTREELNEEPFCKMHWDTQGSGITIPDEIAVPLEKKWAEIRNVPLPVADLKIPNQFLEGARQENITTIYERNPKAREACLHHHGFVCQVCGSDFEKVYGEIGRKFIHVHHRIPLSEIAEEYEVNPIEDLCPVCPNCHAMLHRKNKGFYTINELKQIMEKNQQA